jgi:hypothetical protein
MTEDPAPENKTSDHSEATNGQDHDTMSAETSDDVQAAKPPLSPAAQRALAEAEARRKARYAEAGVDEKEVGGRGGADPARFGDWEINGRAIDF